MTNEIWHDHWHCYGVGGDYWTANAPHFMVNGKTQVLAMEALRARLVVVLAEVEAELKSANDRDGGGGVG